MATVDTIIMKEIVGSLSKNDNDSYSMRDIVMRAARSILAKMPGFVVMIVAKKLLVDSASLIAPILEFIKGRFVAAVFNVRTYNTQDVGGIGYHLSNVIFKHKAVALMQPVISTNACEMKVAFIPRIHDDFLASAEKEAQHNLDMYLAKRNGKSCSMFSAAFKNGTVEINVYKPGTMYPSRNYVALASSIAKWFSVAERTQTYSVMGILIDGEPGLGKTKFGDYAAKMNLAGNIFKIDMTAFMGVTKLSDVLKLTFHDQKITTPTIFIIDEIDKYIEYTCGDAWNRLDKQLRKQVKRYSNFSKFRRDGQLYDILRVIEREGVEFPCAVIFCANNFMSVFAGVNMTHHQSLMNRFLRVEFARAGRDETIDFIRHYAKILDEPVSDDDLAALGDISVTYRTLQHTAIRANYNTREIITLLNASTDTKPAVESIQDVVDDTSEESDDTSEESDDTSDDEKPAKKSKRVKKSKQAKSEESSDDSDEKTTKKPKKVESPVESPVESSLESSMESSLESSIPSTLVSAEDGEDLPAHIQVWNSEFVVTGDSTRGAKAQKVKEIKKYIDEVGLASEGAKRAIIIKMVESVNTPEGLRILNNHASFKTSIVGKIIELNNFDQGLWSLANEGTRRFVYALTGIKCD